MKYVLRIALLLLVAAGAYAGSSGRSLTTPSQVDTAEALAANGANCVPGSYPLGVDEVGAAESCTDASTEILAHAVLETVHHTTTAGRVQFGHVSNTLDESSLLTWDGTTLFANKIDTSNIDGENAHGFKDNPSVGYTCSPGANSGALAMDSTIDATGDQLYFCEENGDMLRVVREDSVGDTALLGRLALPSSLDYTGTSEFVGSRVSVSETTPSTEYILNFRVFTNGQLQNRLRIGTGPIHIKSGNSAGDTGLMFFDEADSANTISLIPPTSIGTTATSVLPGFDGTLALSQVSTVGATGTLDDSVMSGTWFNCTNAGGCVVTLPVLAAGEHFCVHDPLGGGLEIDPNIDDDIVLPGDTAPLTNGNSIVNTGTPAYDYVCLFAYETLHWIVRDNVGTWADKGS